MAEESRKQLAILRFSGELSIKARATRYQFTRRLLHNLRDALESQGIEPSIEVSHDRIFAQSYRRARTPTRWPVSSASSRSPSRRGEAPATSRRSCSTARSSSASR